MRRLRSLLGAGLVGVVGLTSSSWSGPGGHDTDPAAPRRRVVDLDYLGEVTFPTGTLFNATNFGGISGLTYDAARDCYYAISDDRSVLSPARFYTLRIDVSDG